MAPAFVGKQARQGGANLRMGASCGLPLTPCPLDLLLWHHGTSTASATTPAPRAPPSCFFAGLLGDNFTYLLDLARRKVVQPGATVIPAAATVYCMGLEVLTGEVAGFNMAAMNTYRSVASRVLCYVHGSVLLHDRGPWRADWRGGRLQHGRHEHVPVSECALEQRALATMLSTGQRHAHVYWLPSALHHSFTAPLVLACCRQGASHNAASLANILRRRPYSLASCTRLLSYTFDCCRWDATYEAVSLADIPHRRLTRPVRVLEQFFDGDRKARGRQVAGRHTRSIEWTVACLSHCASTSPGPLLSTRLSCNHPGYAGTGCWLLHLLASHGLWLAVCRESVL